MSRLSIHKLRELKANGQRFAMITAYDYPSARLVEQAGVPVDEATEGFASVPGDSSVAHASSAAHCWTTTIRPSFDRYWISPPSPAHPKHVVQESGVGELARYETRIDDGSFARIMLPPWA